ncbi:L,D-transpeptidase family protein [Oceanococcus atlanticus]|uniref:L,D-transpeptidase family protein n=1 Tax=Oceanococcus atlanticus TaxID=1317117 RepID=UPI0009F826E3|nr:L,D-transpeptidase family protein [Oceanococcus atlanticus]
MLSVKRSGLIACLASAALFGAATVVQAHGPLADPAQLVQTPPDFRFDQVLRTRNPGDRQAWSAEQSGLHWRTAPNSLIDDGLQPNAILELDDSVDHVILADLHNRRVYLLENDGELRVLRHMYASIGKAGTRKQIEDDNRTPVGVYTVTRYIDDSALPELYGAGAFPIDYPNHWDRAHQRTGYGIWVHGVPRSHYSRPPLSSEGCVAVGNSDFDSLKPFVTPGNTRVIFSDQLSWLTPAELNDERQRFKAQVEAWRSAWSARDTERYLDYYAEEFSTDDMDRQAFAEHKRRVNAGKSFIEVELADLNIFNYPDGDKLRLVEFVQHYRSDNYASTDRKQQFWRQHDNGQWRIIREISL